jgi:hypothetical protein
MNRKRVSFIGDASHREFRDAVAWLREYSDASFFASPEQFTSRLVETTPPDAVVIAQPRPGKFDQSQIERLHRQAPLARLIALLGGWCEGELRTGTPWRGVTRVYGHQFVPRLANELLAGSPGACLALPRTATDTERCLAAPLPPTIEQPGLVVIGASSFETYESLSEACTQLGHATVWSPRNQPTIASSAMAGIWNCSAAVSTDYGALQHFARTLHPAPTIAIIGFPRGEDQRIALDAGACAVVSKPILLHDLWSELSRLTASIVSSPRAACAA